MARSESEYHCPTVPSYMYSSLTAGFAAPREYSNCTSLGTIWSGRINIGHYSVVPGVHSGSCARCAARWPLGCLWGECRSTPCVCVLVVCGRCAEAWTRGGSERFPAISQGQGEGRKEKKERSGAGGAWKSDGCGVGMHSAGVGTRRARAGAGRVQGQSPVSGGGQLSAESWKLFSISQLNYVATTCALACFRASPRAPRASHLQREMRCGARCPRRPCVHTVRGPRTWPVLLVAVLLLRLHCCDLVVCGSPAAC